MKTSKLATAFESGSVEARRDQANGFVSRTMVSRDGGGPAVQHNQHAVD